MNKEIKKELEKIKNDWECHCSKLHAENEKYICFEIVSNYRSRFVIFHKTHIFHKTRNHLKTITQERYIESAMKEIKIS